MVDILMATYNGEKYISEQIESILNQTVQDFRIIIRDDGSTDSTMTIIQKYRKANPNKIKIIQGEERCGSAVSNFMLLTKYAEADYVMFCDQDDYWVKDKIKILLKRMKEVEIEETPVLVFSSYCPVDKKLECNSNKKKRSLNINNIKLNKLIVQNYVPGCVCMMNKVLCRMMGQYDARILMHDWWAALIASAIGVISYEPQELVMYRQHLDNSVGEVDTSSVEFNIQRFTSNIGKRAMKQYRSQAELFVEEYEKYLDNEKKDIFYGFINIFEKEKIPRMLGLIKGKYYKDNIIRILGEFYYI